MAGLQAHPRPALDVGILTVAHALTEYGYAGLGERLWKRRALRPSPLAS
jgi:hypothetical protein